MSAYTHIVIGAGAIGSAAAFWLSQLPGTNVLVIEQFELVNIRYSSGDHSWIIRHAYQSTNYTRLTGPAYQVWAEVQERSGLQVLLKTGGLDLAGTDEGSLDELAHYRASMRAVGTPYEDLSAQDVRERFPQWRVKDDVTGIFQADGGLIDIRRSVSAHTSMALAAGVTFLPHTKVAGIQIHDDSVTVQTPNGSYSAGHLVVAAASWLGDLMPDLGLDFELTLSQEQVSYFSTPHLGQFASDRFPIWIYHARESYYGFQVYGEAALKLARDLRKHFISSDERVFKSDDTEAKILHSFLEQHLPAATGLVWANKTCVYDMPADRDFVLDVLPEHRHVAVSNGAGHAGEFASLMDQILADLVTSGSSKHPIEAFSLLRPAITDPSFTPRLHFGLPKAEPAVTTNFHAATLEISELEEAPLAPPSAQPPSRRTATSPCTAGCTPPTRAAGSSRAPRSPSRAAPAGSSPTADGSSRSSPGVDGAGGRRGGGAAERRRHRLRPAGLAGRSSSPPPETLALAGRRRGQPTRKHQH